MVTIAPRDGLVKQIGNTQIGHDAIHRLHGDNPRLQVTSKTPRNVRVAGSSGLITMMASDSPLGGAQTDVLVTVMRPRACSIWC